MAISIPFNKPYLTGGELECITQAYGLAQLSGDGAFTKLCHNWLEVNVGCKRGLLTHSCTAALEMAALLLDIQPGDEVIMPSYTFVSTANAFVLRGATPVFIDIRGDTLNLDERLIEPAISPRTKAIVPVHYAGVACEMDAIMKIAARYQITVIEDAAQGVMSKYKNRPLGSIGHLGAYSFHETKNLISGEGGALLINNSEMTLRAEIIREKGTDRSQFFRGMVDKYTWRDMGSSFLPGEMIAAFLWAQLQKAIDITEMRMESWSYYNHLLGGLEVDGKIRRPIIPDDCDHNAHMYYVLIEPNINRETVLRALRNQGINAVFHYVPLHSSPGGLRFGVINGCMDKTDELSSRIIRLPLYCGITKSDQEIVANALARALNKSTK